MDLKLKYTWRILNQSLATMPELEVKALLDAEMIGDKRVMVIERLHQRYNALRVAREREEMIELAKKSLPSIKREMHLDQQPKINQDQDSNKLKIEVLDNFKSQHQPEASENWLDIIANERKSSLVLPKSNKSTPDINNTKEINEQPRPIIETKSDLINTALSNNLKNNENPILNENILTDNNPFIEGKLIQIGINDLEKHNEEAIFDALNYFNKKCPYCNKDQYRIGVRDRIEIDHFIPISRGGQNVPWNLVPVCKECNRKKKAALPSTFLDHATFKVVNDYLTSIKNKFLEQGIYQFSNFQIMENLIVNNKEFIRKNLAEKFIIDLIEYLKIEGNKYLPDDLNLNSDLIEDIKEMRGIFKNGAIGSPLDLICISIKNEYGLNLTQDSLKVLLKKSGWIDAGRLKSREFDSKKQIFHSPNLNDLSKSQLRRIIELK